MNKYINVLLSALFLILFGACSKETPFDNEENISYGMLRTSALDVSLNSEYGPRSVKNRNIRAAAPNVADFYVEFFKDGNSEPEAAYKYSDMPEIVTLPVGNYVARASHGANADAAWDEPYYMGESLSFDIVADEITDVVDPIVCKFANVRVSIDFDPELRKAMGADCKVNVVVGEKGSLDFTINDVERSGYFAYVADSKTLAAHFSGTVDGAPASETKAYKNVEPGTHYKITFRLHDAGEEDPGNITGDDIVKVDASLSQEDMNASVDSGETVITDDMRPQEEETQQPDVPNPPTPGAELPEITAQAPLDLDVVNELEVVQNSEGEDVSKFPVVLNIHSSADGGIKAFTVKIISDTLTPSTLVGVGLTDELDLVNPGQYEGGLSGLGFPVNVGGMKDVEFKITDFVPLLAALGEGNHSFVLTVTDANGTTQKTLKLHNKAN